jgi:hypothetical protein
VRHGVGERQFQVGLILALRVLHDGDAGGLQREQIRGTHRVEVADDHGRLQAEQPAVVQPAVRGEDPVVGAQVRAVAGRMTQASIGDDKGAHDK